MSHGGGDHHPDPPAPLDLLDEYWFFNNTLNVKNSKKPPRSIAKPQRQAQDLSGCRRRLLRTPSLPLPRASRPVEDEQAATTEVDDEDLNWSSIYEGIVRSRIAAQGSRWSSSSPALQRAPSMPLHEHDGGRSKLEEMPPKQHNNKLRHSYSTLERHCTPSNNKQTTTPRSSREVARSQQQQPVTTMVRSKSTLFHQPAADKKKWKSSSDLECIEVQGFKDLGFVFDKEELREDLADVLPGFKNATAADHGAVPRPYLSEAWHQDRRRSAPPALIRVQSEARSAAEMKDQLRMWAQAVACNVRQECA